MRWFGVACGLMQFEVNPDELARFASSLSGDGGLSATVSVASGYHEQWCQFKGGSGIFMHFTGIASDAYSKVDKALKQVQSALDSSAAAVGSISGSCLDAEQNSAAGINSLAGTV